MMDVQQGPITYEGYLRSVPCHRCNVINFRRPSRICDKCAMPYHIKCVDLTKRLSRELRSWICATCRNHNNNNEGINADDLPVIDDEAIVAQLPQLIGNWKQHIKVLQRVPKGARVAAAESYCKLVDNVGEGNGLFAWARLFGFAYSALAGWTRPKDG